MKKNLEKHDAFFPQLALLETRGQKAANRPPVHGEPEAIYEKAYCPREIFEEENHNGPEPNVPEEEMASNKHQLKMKWVIVTENGKRQLQMRWSTPASCVPHRGAA